MRWPRIWRGCFPGIFLLMIGFPDAGFAQIDSREGIALQNQLFQLRQEVQKLRADSGRNNGGNPGIGGGGDIAAQLLSRVQTMEEQLRQLRGRIDETQNLANRRNMEMTKRIDDLTFQLNMQHGSVLSGPPPAGLPAPPQPPVPETRPPEPRIVIPGASVVPAPQPQAQPPQPRPSFTFNPLPEPMREIPPPPVEARMEPPRPQPGPYDPSRRPAPVPPPVASTLAPAPAPIPDVVATPIPPGGKRTPEMALQEGNAALARRDYPAAERAAREVMSNRASPRAYDGQFLLAKALEGQKQFPQSAIAFDDTYNRSHKGRHAQDALLGLAGALTAINERRAACDTLSRLRLEFPQVRADLKDAKIGRAHV